MGANPNWGLGRTSEVYVGEEATYAAAASLAATNAIRTLPSGVKLSFNPRNLAPSPERHTHPSLLALLTRRQSGSFDLKAQMYPSGTLNTLPEADLLFKNSLGNIATNITLSTTVASGAGVSGAVVASATGLAIGQPIQIGVLGGSNPGVYVRWLTGVSTNTLTWAPPLPSTCAVSDTVKGCTGYALGTALPKSLDIAYYPQAPSASTPARELLGCVADKISFMFDSNLEPMFQVSGPAQGFAGSSPNFTPQSQPGAYTTVGGESIIPSGLKAYFQYGSTLYEIEKLQLDIVNGMLLKNTAMGTSKATGFMREGKRIVTIKIDAKVSDDTTLWTPSLGSSSSALMIQCGDTSTKIWGLYCPAVILTDNPDTPDNDGTNNWSFQGQALGTVGNDEVYLAAA